MQQLSITEVFTGDEIVAAADIWRSSRTTQAFHDRVKKGIIAEALPRINERSGQENDPAYLAYLLEYLVNR